MNGTESENRSAEAGMPDPLTGAGIRSFLSPAAQFLAERIQVYPVLASTNLTAKKLAMAGAEHGTAIFADRQTAGRGRMNRSFSSPAGGLYMSLILKAEMLPFREISFVTPAAGVAVCEAVEEVTGEKPGIKWVNDLLMDGKKICGILTEAVTGPESGQVNRVVVGIGVNIHARKADFPPEVQDIAGSIDPERTIPDLRNRLAAAILNRMTVILTADQTKVLERYKTRLMMIGKSITVVQSEQTWRATALDLDGDGRLIVRKENGETVSLSSGEIRIRL